jgi:hypothetical protein
MDERELVGLLYRADWTRLALTGTVRGADWMPNTNFTHRWRSWETGPRSHRFPLPDPPQWMTESTDEQWGAERSLVLRPGRRYRVTSSGGSRVIGCDGERAWQWFAQPPTGTKVTFDHRPGVPVPELLAPVWLLLGYRLTVGEETTVAGRPGIAITGVARPGRIRGFAGSALLPWGLLRRPDRVTAVIDAEFGIVLRRELSRGDDGDEGGDEGGGADVTEFLSVEFGGSANPSAFTAPEGSFFGGGPGGGRASERRAVDEAGLTALKMVGGLAAGGLGAAVRYAPKRRADPFAAATAEDPDDAMPDDEPLPGWAADGADGAAGSDGVGGRGRVSDEVLDLLYRGGLELSPFSGTLHAWTDFEAVANAMLGAVPESARQAGFGGVGFLVDTILADDRDVGQTLHAVDQVRVGAWDRYRVDRVRRAPTPATPATPARRLWLRGDDGDPLTVACDGERTFQVFPDEVRVWPASELNEGRQGDLHQLLDASWLLMHRLSGGEVIEVDGRPAYRVIATAGTGPVTGAPLSWLPAWWLPAVAVLDASSGRLLRLMRYRNGKVVTRLELRSVAEGGSDDFGFTPPEGLPVVDEPERHSSHGSDEDDTESSGPGGGPWAPPEDLRAAAEAVKKQVDEKVAAARGFLGSFLGGRG